MYIHGTKGFAGTAARCPCAAAEVKAETGAQLDTGAACSDGPPASKWGSPKAESPPACKNVRRGIGVETCTLDPDIPNAPLSLRQKCSDKLDGLTGPAAQTDRTVPVRGQPGKPQR